MKYKNLTLQGIEKLAKELYRKSGGEYRVFGLVGPLGSGKTTFTKALAANIGVRNAKSPTFVVVHCYQKGKKSLYHIDLYRLEKARELDALGIDEIMADQDSLVAIEWIDKFPKLMEKCDAIVKFEVLKDNLRNVTVTNN
jgi:tRNA threonylcarbamoyladenosine biosynthesis protein TsaE